MKGNVLFRLNRSTAFIDVARKSGVRIDKDARQGKDLLRYVDGLSFAVVGPNEMRPVFLSLGHRLKGEREKEGERGLG